jgi:murein DD-endopeptidase MepM/ murein hydrolase activator NlpD
MEPPETQDYSYLAIRHANGYVSVYGHLSEIMVGEYDFVKE